MLKSKFERFQLRAKFQIAMILCLRLIQWQIPVAAGGFELQISCLISSYLTH